MCLYVMDMLIYEAVVSIVGGTLGTASFAHP